VYARAALCFVLKTLKKKYVQFSKSGKIIKYGLCFKNRVSKLHEEDGIDKE